MNHAALSRRVLLAAAILTPSAAVIGVRAVAPHAGPARASAGSAPAARIEPVQPLRPQALTGKQPALAAALRGRALEFTSPFVVPMSEAAREGLLQAGKGKSQTAKTPEFTITSIVAGAQTIAVVNGKAHRAGDALDEGWTLESIDAQNRCATIRHAELGVMVLKIKAELE